MAEFYLDADVSMGFVALLTKAGHSVHTTTEAGRRRAGDEEQLAYAAQRGRILITHNNDDFLLLQRAWRNWADLWSVEPRPIHSGILSVPQHQSVEILARAIDHQVRSGKPLRNRFYTWTRESGWVQFG